MIVTDNNETATGNVLPPPKDARPRRRRRSSEDVARRIREAARDLFGERGYAAATTREIARRAEVSETLLFRYYGDKAGLFADVVTAPFRQLVEQIRTGQPENHQDSTAKSQAERLTEDVFVLLESNATLFRALLVESLVQGPQKDGHELAGLMPLFDSAIAEIQTRYAKAGQSPPIDPAVGVRLGFAMIMGSVLIRDMLFPTPPARDKVLAALQFMITRTLIGPQID